MKKLLGREKLQAAFSPELFKQKGHELIDRLGEYLEHVQSGVVRPVLPAVDPDRMMDRWQGHFPETVCEPGNWDAMVRDVISLSNHLHHPGYIGHQCTSPLPLAALTDLLGAFLNNGSAVYEMGPVNVAMEKRVLEWMAEKIGFPGGSDGVFTSGGTLGNLTALLAARQVQSESNVWKHGIDSGKGLSILASEHAHYSVTRAAAIMGLGEDAVVQVPAGADFVMSVSEVGKAYQRARKNGRQVFALVANACSTATGTYDRIPELADFCADHSLWLHVDSAHGAAAVLSKKYRRYLDGIHRADSIVWDAHKMLLMPALTTAVIFRNGSHSFAAFSQKASYLFGTDGQTKDEWYNFAHRTMECTKKMMGLKLYMAFSYLGSDYFADYIDYTYDLTRRFARILREAGDFELPVPPQSNIICFRFLKKGLDRTALNALQKEIRRKILKSERFYVVQTDLRGCTYLRCTLINPLTRLEELAELLDAIRSLA